MAICLLIRKQQRTIAGEWPEWQKRWKLVILRAAEEPSTSLRPVEEETSRKLVKIR